MDNSLSEQRRAEIPDCLGMTRRFTLDRPSFEQFLGATSLIQQLNRQVRNGRAPDEDDTQPLSDLVEAQLAIESGAMDLEAAMHRVIGLAVKLSRATGAATWLFNGHEFVYRAGAGSAANDERLHLEVLSKLASTCGPGDPSLHDPRESNHWRPAPDAIRYPGSVESLLIAPIYHGRNIAGALAVFSAQSNVFTERDTTKARLLSGLLAHALGKAAEAELKQKVSLERATMLQAIEQLIPALRKLAEKDKPESQRSPNRSSSLFTELETVQALGAISQERGDCTLENFDSTSTLRAVTDKTELTPGDHPILRKGNEQTGAVTDDTAPPAYLEPVPTQARESTGASVLPKFSALRNGAQPVGVGIRKDSPFRAAIALTELAHRQLAKARLWLLTTMDTLGSFISSIATYQSRILVPAGLKSKPRMAIPAAVLLMMLVFLFLKITEGHPPKTAAASETGAAAKLATAGDPSEALDQRSGPVPANQLSHMRVTDPAMSSELQTLSRYEIVGLRRRAVYGDDAAAFLLGMAYETGHLVPQSCVRAGEWVTKSANEGNVAAQYNLGLRYQHGDGEPVNQEVGARWLRKAAAQRYVQAQLALESAP